MGSPSVADLPLAWWTPARWADEALAEPLALLDDHAHLERKAASNALMLLTRYPDPVIPERWVETLTGVARDEAEHLALVARLLAKRGGRLTKDHRNPYAAALFALVRLGRGTEELADRLLVSALIEARSCERFWLLADAAGAAGDDELRKLYSGLWASEHGHYRVFVALAGALLLPEAVVAERWQALLAAEGQIIACQPPGPTMHGGLAPSEDDGS